MEYIALIHKDGDSDYGVSFPDFPGCVTAGRTLDEARSLAAGALAFHIEGMVEDGESLPAPSDLSAVMSEREHRDAVAFLVAVESRSRTVRVNITLTEADLGRIDRYAAEHGYTRSGFLLQAARHVMTAERRDHAGT